MEFDWRHFDFHPPFVKICMVVIVAVTIYSLYWGFSLMEQRWRLRRGSVHRLQPPPKGSLNLAAILAGSAVLWTVGWSATWHQVSDLQMLNVPNSQPLLAVVDGQATLLIGWGLLGVVLSLSSALGWRRTLRCAKRWEHDGAQSPSSIT